MWGCNEKTDIYNPGSGLSPDTRSASTLILDLQPPELWQKYCCVSHPVCGMWYCSSSWLKQKSISVTPLLISLPKRLMEKLILTNQTPFIKCWFIPTLDFVNVIIILWSEEILPDRIFKTNVDVFLFVCFKASQTYTALFFPNTMFLKMSKWLV